MIMRGCFLYLLVLIVSISISACNSQTTLDEQTEDVFLGQFRVNKDLFLAQFDSKSDVDDIHSIAAIATMLADPRFSGVRYHAVAGAYGVQTTAYVPSNELFDRVFGDNWSDAHTDFSSAVTEVSDLVVARLKAGGDIWIAEAGQSDFSAAVIKNAVKRLPSIDVRSRTNIVQHSKWNEKQTRPENLAYVKSYGTYHKIPDGNREGNGSPGFKTPALPDWREQLNDPELVDIWQMAIDIANHYNGLEGRYSNKVILEGGMDFSDVSEMCWIFGFDHIVGAEQFFTTFGFKKLFNGKNWDGWYLKLRSGDAEMAKKVFAISDGMVHVFNDAFPDEYNLGTGANDTHGMFYTNDVYSKYVLRFEYKWGSRIANNFDQWQYDAGAYYHVIDDAIWPVGIEYQMRYDHTTGRNHTGDLIRPAGTGYDWFYNPETNDFLHPKDGGVPYEKKHWMHFSKETDNHNALNDKWNQVEIVVMGSEYAIHKLNGDVVNMAVNLKPEAGIIGFQAETAELFYRNFWIKEFDSVVPAEAFLP